MEFVKARAKHVGRITHWWWATIYGVWTLVCSFDVIVEHYGSDSFKRAYDSAWIAPKWGWEVWVIGVLLITVFTLLESSYRHTREREKEHQTMLLKTEAERIEVENRLYDGRPLLVLRVAVIAGSREKGKPEYSFYIQNCGQRAARWVMLEDTTSTLGKYRLTFSRIAVAEPEKQAYLGYDVYTIGQPSTAATIGDFLADHDSDAYVVWFDIKIEFRDTDDSIRDDTARLSYWPTEQVLSSSEVPYTRRSHALVGDVGLPKQEETIASVPAQPAISGAHWLDLEARFDDLSKFLNVQLHSASRDGQRTDNWKISGNVSESKKCEALCARGGAMLMKSPNVCTNLSDDVRNAPNDAERWFCYLRDAGIVKYEHGPGREDYGGGTTLHHLGSISGIAAVSSRVCIELSAKEL